MTDHEFNKHVDAVLTRYGKVLHELAQGPQGREWPCPHNNRQIDERNDREFCLECYHWLEK